MQIVEKRLDELTPYENNPRKNDNAVPYVAESIRRYGFKQPIVVDADGD
jgi:ParB-like chromosome segregation protein Spo0J